MNAVKTVLFVVILRMLAPVRSLELSYGLGYSVLVLQARHCGDEHHWFGLLGIWSGVLPLVQSCLQGSPGQPQRS